MNKFCGIAILLGLWTISASVVEVRASIDFTAFHTPSQMDSELTNLATTHSSIAQIFTIGNSVEGRPIRGIKISSTVVTNSLRVPAEFIVRVDPESLLQGWRVEIPAPPQTRQRSRKALLLNVKNNVLEPGENLRQPISIVPPPNMPKGSAVEINLSGVLLPLVRGKRVPLGNGYTFRVVKRY